MADKWYYPLCKLFPNHLEVSQLGRCMSKLRRFDFTCFIQFKTTFVILIHFNVFRGAKDCVVVHKRKTLPDCLTELGQVDNRLYDLLAGNRDVVESCRGRF